MRKKMKIEVAEMRNPKVNQNSDESCASRNSKST